MGRHQEAVKAYREYSPSFNSYIECMFRAYTAALSSFALTFGFSYFGQKIYSKHLPYGLNSIILVSSGLSCAVAYKVVSGQALICQKAWMAQEDKHTCLNSIEERQNSDISS